MYKLEFELHSEMNTYVFATDITGLLLVDYFFTTKHRGKELLYLFHKNELSFFLYYLICFSRFLTFSLQFLNYRKKNLEF